MGAGSNPEHVLTDQRGAARSGASGTDIGAYQSGPAVDVQAPTATLAATDVDASNASALNPYTFTITYADNLAIKATSLAATVVQVARAGRGLTDHGDRREHRCRKARVTPPAMHRRSSSLIRSHHRGDAWTEADDGTYHVTLASGPPTDLAGNPVATGTVGSFTVKVYSGSLSVTAQPQGSVAAGAGFGLTVQAKDDQGQLISNFDEDVTLSVANDQGPARFMAPSPSRPSMAWPRSPDYRFSRPAADYTITAATIVGVNSVSTTPIQVTAAPASKLAVVNVLPASIVGNTEFEVDVVAKDPYGNVDQSFTGPLTIVIAGGTAGAVLGGTTTVHAVAGVATFSDLVVDKAGAGYTLKVTGGSLTPATTNAFTVTPAAVLQFSASSESIVETAGEATIQVVRSGGYEGAVSVNVATSGGTAVPGVNYTSFNTTLNFLANQDSATFQYSNLECRTDPGLDREHRPEQPGQCGCARQPERQYTDNSQTAAVHAGATSAS